MKLTGTRVLLAQEDPEALSQVSQILSREGCYLLATRDGTEVARLLEFAPPDLVLFDLALPGYSGDDLLVKMRATPAWRLVPVIILSSRSCESKMAHVFELGADDFISKPYSAGELLARTRKRLAESRRLKALWADVQRRRS